MEQKKYDFSKMEESKVITDEVQVRFKKGLGSNIFIIGLSGTGKSSSSIRLGELLIERTEKKIKMTIVSSLLELLDAIRGSKLGDIIVVEEVSVLFSSRRSMAKDNVSVNQIFDTIRKKQLCLISNAPILGSIDSHMRAMGHMIIETLRINKSQGVVISKTFRLQTNPRSGKTYFHRFTNKGRDVHRIFTRKPNSKTWEDYESKKDKSMDKLYERLKHEQEEKENKAIKSMMKNQKVNIRKLTALELETHNLINVKGLSQKEVAKSLGVDVSVISRRLQNITNKSKISKEIEENGNKNKGKPPLT